MNGRGLAGVHFRPASFEPTFHKHARRALRRLSDPRRRSAAFRPMRAAVELLGAIHREAPDQPLWRDPPYEYETVKPPIDILYGSDRLRRGIDAGETPRRSCAGWAADEAAFRRLRERYLLY